MTKNQPTTVTSYPHTPQHQQPAYRPVVFLDRAADYRFLTRSTARTDATTVWEDGRVYPLVTLDVSSASHPFFTGRQASLDPTGRVERFHRRAARQAVPRATPGA